MKLTKVLENMNKIENNQGFARGALFYNSFFNRPLYLSVSLANDKYAKISIHDTKNFMELDPYLISDMFVDGSYDTALLDDCEKTGWDKEVSVKPIASLDAIIENDTSKIVELNVEEQYNTSNINLANKLIYAFEELATHYNCNKVTTSIDSISSLNVYDIVKQKRLNETLETNGYKKGRIGGFKKKLDESFHGYQFCKLPSQLRVMSEDVSIQSILNSANKSKNIYSM